MRGGEAEPGTHEWRPEWRNRGRRRGIGNGASAQLQDVFLRAHSAEHAAPRWGNLGGFAVTTDTNTSCAWSVGAGLDYEQMTPFTSGQGTNFHRTTFAGLSADTLKVNTVTVRCGAGTSYVLELKYRALPAANPHFPRTGNLWGSWHMIKEGVDHAARIDLYNGASFTEAQARSLREKNPDILITRVHQYRRAQHG